MDFILFAPFGANAVRVLQQAQPGEGFPSPGLFLSIQSVCRADGQAARPCCFTE